VPLGEWWAFWRSGKITGVATQKALATARELGLFDDRWFLENVDGRSGKLKGTDTLCDSLSKEQITSWLRNVHQSGDGSPAGLVAALGWDVILARTSQEALLFALDALARHIGLVVVPVVAAEHTEPALAVSPADLDPPSMDSFFSAPPPVGVMDDVAEARAAMLASIAEDQTEAVSRKSELP
jgi:hypothetical protein